MVKTVHVIGNDEDTVNMFAEKGWSCVTENPDLVCFTGGADVSPELYLQGYEGTRGTNPLRDLLEVGWYLHYQRQGIPMAGICRGGQFLNVMCGGTLIQDLPVYTSGLPTVEDVAGNRFKVRADHHQGIVPTKGVEVLLTRDIQGERVTYACLYGNFWDSSTLCFQPHSLTLCFQPHPEWGHDPTKELFFHYIEEHLCP